MKKLNKIIKFPIIGLVSLLVIAGALFAVNPIIEEPLVRCGSGQYMDMDINTCLLKSSIQPTVIVEEKIVIETVTETITEILPLKVIRGINDKQNIFIVDNGENPIVFLQDCDGLTVLTNPLMSGVIDGNFILRDSTAGITIFIDRISAYQYEITTVPYTGESLNTIGTELMRSDLYKLKCDIVEKKIVRNVFQYDVQLKNNVLRIDGTVGSIVDNKYTIPGMIVLVENGRMINHLESFTINLGSTGEFFETINVDGTSNSGKTWKYNETYRVLISYNGEQITKDFEK